MDKFSFWAIFSVVFLAEIPCILRTVAIQLKSEGIWNVIAGTAAGSAAALLVGILLAKLMQGGVPPAYSDYVGYVSGIGLIVLGVMFLLKIH